jgi:hypothetical protein
MVYFPGFNFGQKKPTCSFEPVGKYKLKPEEEEGVSTSSLMF